MNWRDQILQEFPPQVAHLTLVADPDGLMVEEDVLRELQARGYAVLFFENSIAFRFAYETRYRHRADKEGVHLVVIVPADKAGLQDLPYDIWQSGRQLSFSLSDLFPRLDHRVLMALERGHLDAVYQAQAEQGAGPLGYNATCDFVLKSVFEIEPAAIRQAVDLLRLLLRRHYQKQRVPALLDRRLMQKLGQHQIFSDWPLEKILPDREAFLSFLQERWPLFLETQTPEPMIREPGEAYLAYAGPALLPFEHSDVWVFIDNLFLEGLLRPIAYGQAHSFANSRYKVGLRFEAKADALYRLSRLLTAVEAAAPGPEAKHPDWLAFAYRWAELIVLWQQTKSAATSAQKQQFQALQQKIDQDFVDWAGRRYGGLYNQPALRAVMVHHIPRAMARYLEESAAQGRQARAALLVIDGLALDQWLILRDSLAQQRPHLKFQEEAVFCWIPTLTPVSRQAIFAGKLPLYYPEAIYSTQKEAGYWEQFWQGQGLPAEAAAYEKGLREEKDLARVEQILAHPKLQVVGLVIDKVDLIMHGMELGTAGMHNQVRQWVAEQTFMAGLLDLLLEQGFGIFLTADHGNIEAGGCGSPGEGAIADIRGERVRVYPDPGLRAKIKEKFPQAIEWPPLGLPEDYYPLLAPHRRAFVQEGRRVVGHGGISVEEVIAPLIKIGRRDDA